MAKIKFEFSLDRLKELSADILQRSMKYGATSANVEINESIANNVDILNQRIETFEASYERTLVLTVYLDGKRGSIGLSRIEGCFDDAIKKALEIAQYTQSDPASGIPDVKDMCVESPNDLLDLKLYNPIELDNQKLIDKAINLESIALNVNPMIITSDGAAINFVEHNFIIANTNGLNLGYKTSRYSSSISLIGVGSNTNNTAMQTDYWYTSSRDFYDLSSDEHVALTAVDRVSRRLNKGSIVGGEYSIIFEPSIAQSLIANFIGAISGGNLYRRLSFLNDSINQQIFPNWVNIIEDPFLIKGLSSCYFDGEGVKVSKRDLVKNGCVKGYLLSSYSARKMGLQTTGNASGCHNIIVQNNFNGSISDLCLELNQGLVIIDTIGHGLNMVTGDYSVGASGLWVADGRVQFYVDNLTVVGNLKDIFNRIRYISNDYEHGSILCGSMLVDGVRVVI